MLAITFRLFLFPFLYRTLAESIYQSLADELRTGNHLEMSRPIDLLEESIINPDLDFFHKLFALCSELIPK